MKTEPL